MSAETSKINLFIEILGSCFKSGDEFLFHCPFCHHRKRKLSINFQKNVWKCWICEASGQNLNYLVNRFGSPTEKQTWAALSGNSSMAEKSDLLELLRGEEKIEVEEKLSLPEEFRTLVSNKADILSIPARNYLYSRGIVKEDIFFWKIGYALRGDYENRIIVPSFSVTGDVNFFVGRSYLGDWSKYKNPSKKKNLVFNELFIDFRRPVVLTEGVFDAIKAGPNSIPLLGSTLDKKSKLFFEIAKNNSTVYLALDVDAKRKEFKIIKSFLEYDIDVRKIIVAPYKDVGEMTKEVFEKRKAEAIKYNKQMLLVQKLIGG